ncbi:GNAT family N-acetyltransferase [Nostoc sp. MS1]|uniref:GNAT family N-acetyltransferase n=1 Tax=Nostoc sp. MS1 TaxID=2764711 RepID=UPI001CC55806|nr:GNAT family N-acetyltransferase [Nostoc sp. MS1]BCL38923.1 hypothetical protein NSMS1_53700 [Nostoc sp. MS1]
MLIIIRLICLETYVVECNHRIVGVAKLLRRPGRIILRNLYVTPTYRHQGIDAALVNYTKQQFSKPIYLASVPDLVPYFISLGFIRISSDRLPYIITSDRLFSSPTTHELVPMVFDDQVALSPSVSNIAITLLDFSVDNCLTRIAQAEDINLIRYFLFKSRNIEFALPFGISFSIIITCLNLLITIFSILIIILPIFFVITQKQLSFSLLHYFSWLLIFLLAILIVVYPISVFLLSQKFSQFWLLQYNQGLIGYARISHKSRYSILYHLYIDNRFKQACEVYFIQKILQSINKPILVACDSNNISIYRQLGFIPIPIQNLPKKLRLGARINFQWGGMNLVHPNNQASQ